MTTIYVLCEPDGKTIRYVGQTKHPKQRYAQHLADGKKNTTEKERWLYQLRNRGEFPIMRKLDEIDENEQDPIAIELAWLRYLKSKGYRMTNGPDSARRKPLVGYPFADNLRYALGSVPLASPNDFEAKVMLPYDLVAGFSALAETVRTLSDEAGLEVDVSTTDIIHLVLSAYLADVDAKLVSALADEFSSASASYRSSGEYARKLRHIERWYSK